MAHEEQSAFSDPTTVDVWLKYSQDRFEDANERLRNYRSWGRDMVGWISVVIGLEVNLIPRLAEVLSKGPSPELAIALQVILGTLLLQAVCLTAAGWIGFRPQKLRSPEGPEALVRHLTDVPAVEARRIIAAYYATAYTSHHERAERLSGSIKNVTRGFVATIWAFALAAVIYGSSFL